MLGELVFINNSLKNTINEEVKIVVLSNVDLLDIQKETLLDCKYEYRRID